MAPTNSFSAEDDMGDTSNGPIAEWLPPREFHPLTLRHYLYVGNMMFFLLLGMTTQQAGGVVGFVVATVGLIVYDTDLRKKREIIKSLEAL